MFGSIMLHWLVLIYQLSSYGKEMLGSSLVDLGNSWSCLRFLIRSYGVTSLQLDISKLLATSEYEVSNSRKTVLSSSSSVFLGDWTFIWCRFIIWMLPPSNFVVHFWHSCVLIGSTNYLFPWIKIRNFSHRSNNLHWLL